MNKMNTLNNNTISNLNNIDNNIVSIHDHILRNDLNDERMLERNTNNL